MISLQITGSSRSCVCGHVLEDATRFIEGKRFSGNSQKKEFFIVLKRNSSLEIKTDKLESMAELEGSVSVDSLKKVSR